MNIRRMALVLIASASVFAFAACGDGDENGSDVTPEATPTVDATAEPSSTPAASPTTTGDGVSEIASVDAAIDLVLAGNYEAVEDLFVFQMVACAVDVLGAGGPPQCEADEADGTEVQVLPVFQCEGAYLRPQDVFFAQRLRDQEMDLYGVYEAPAEIFPPGDYAVLFSYVRPAMPGTTLALELMMNDEGVTGVNFGCGEDPGTIVERQGLEDPIVPPTSANGTPEAEATDAIVEP